MHWFGAILERAEDLPVELRARALRDLGGSSEVVGEYEQALTWYGQSLELYEQLGEEFGILHLRFRRSQVLARSRDFDAARTLAEETLQRARQAGIPLVEADTLHVLSIVAFLEGDMEEAFQLQLESLDIHRSLGGWPWGESVKLGYLSTQASHLGRPDEGDAYGREALAMSREIGSRIRVLTSLAALALAARAAGDAERAGRLWGAIEAEHERSPHRGWPSRRDDFARHVLEPNCAELERGLALGRRMTLDEAAAYALDEEAAGR
jgi:tetratricopeptide (TPR) repeat protein